MPSTTKAKTTFVLCPGLPLEREESKTNLSEAVKVETGWVEQRGRLRFLFKIPPVFRFGLLIV